MNALLKFSVSKLAVLGSGIWLVGLLCLHNGCLDINPYPANVQNMVSS